MPRPHGACRGIGHAYSLSCITIMHIGVCRYTSYNTNSYKDDCVEWAHMNEHIRQILERWVHCSGYDCNRKSCIEQLVSTHHAINNKVRTLCAHHFSSLHMPVYVLHMHVCGSIELLFMCVCMPLHLERTPSTAISYARKSLPVRAPMLASRCSCDSSPHMCELGSAAACST